MRAGVTRYGELTSTRWPFTVRNLERSPTRAGSLPGEGRGVNARVLWTRRDRDLDAPSLLLSLEFENRIELLTARIIEADRDVVLVLHRSSLHHPEVLEFGRELLLDAPVRGPFVGFT